MTTTQSEKAKNPLLERARLPGETFVLPSLGLFYSKDQVECENGEIYIYPMTTLEQILLSSPDKLFSGDAINDVFKRCCPQIKKPLEMLSKDVDFVLSVLRKISFGENSEVSYIHDCKDAKVHSYAINLGKFIENAKHIDPTKIKSEYEKNLSNGQQIKLGPPRFLPTLKLYQVAMENSNKEESPEDIVNTVLESIATMIIEVDEISDQKMIKEWLAIISPEMIEEIKNYVINASTWGSDYTTKTKCQDCGKEIDISSEINPVTFFF